MRRGSILLFCFLLAACSGLGVRTHQQSQTQMFWEENEKKSESVFLTILIIFLAVVVAIVAMFCLCARYASRRNNGNMTTTTVQPSPFYLNNNMNPLSPQFNNPQFQPSPAFNNYNQQFQYPPPNNYPFPNTGFQGNVSPYDNRVPQIRTANDAGQAAKTAAEWSEPDYFAESSLRENCSFCNSFELYGLEPRVVLGCKTGHAFHIACLSQFRSTQAKSSLCPTCREPVPSRVRLFCSRCKQRSVGVELSQFSDKDGVINTAALLSRFGELCPQCSYR